MAYQPIVIQPLSDSDDNAVSEKILASQRHRKEVIVIDDNSEIRDVSKPASAPGVSLLKVRSPVNMVKKKIPKFQIIINPKRLRPGTSNEAKNVRKLLKITPGPSNERCAEKKNNDKNVSPANIKNKNIPKPKMDAPVNMAKKLVNSKDIKIQNDNLRKSKRRRKETRFSDCVKLNSESETESASPSENSDSEGSSADEVEDDSICSVCMSYEPPIEFEKGSDVASFELKWIDCDMCHNWFHWFCVGIFDDSEDTNYFKCKICRSKKVK